MAALRRSNSITSTQRSGPDDERRSVGGNRSAALRALICRMLRRKPSDRPSILDIGAHEQLRPYISETQLANLQAKQAPELSPIRLPEFRVSTPTEHEVKEVLRSPATPMNLNDRARLIGSTGKRKRSDDTDMGIDSNLGTADHPNNYIIRSGLESTANESSSSIKGSLRLNPSGVTIAAFCVSGRGDYNVYTNDTVESNEDELSLECRPRRLLAELEDIE
jgi:hypothetical protein